MISSINDELPAPPGLAQSSQPSNSPETTVSTGRTFPTGVGAPALLEDLQDDREGTTLLVIHRFQALLPCGEHNDSQAALGAGPSHHVRGLRAALQLRSPDTFRGSPTGTVALRRRTSSPRTKVGGGDPSGTLRTLTTGHPKACCVAPGRA